VHRVTVLGVPVDPLTVDELHDRLDAFISSDARATVLHVNVHGINLACRHDWFRQLLGDADLVFCDGAGVRLGARLLGQWLPPRITYADWTWQLAEWCAATGRRLFFLGARPGIAESAARRLRERFPTLVVNTHHGYFDLSADSPASLQVIDSINAARPHILIVGFGMPLQERWIADHRPRLAVPVVLSGGAAFDYVSGEVRRAPAWMCRMGLEWLGRLLIEPRRLMRRYVIGNPLFLARVLRERWR
jgi:N-acetylglucosaminyldiphosphoundecaprenol N-acetyl-beta-D-mannosaminyltransferase